MTCESEFFNYQSKKESVTNLIEILIKDFSQLQEKQFDFFSQLRSKSSITLEKQVKT